MADDRKSNAVDAGPVQVAARGRSNVLLAAQEDEQTRDEAAERKLGRTAAIGIPAATIAASAIVGTLTSAGPAILVLAGGTLVGTISLLWASLRTLGGDAPLPEDLEAVAARGSRAEDLAARKASILRALRDLEHERSIGKIDDDDYAELATYYREQAKTAMREMDAEVAPLRGRAEQIAKTYLKKRGLEAEAKRAEAADDDEREDAVDEVDEVDPKGDASETLDESADDVGPVDSQPPPPVRRAKAKSKTGAARSDKAAARTAHADRPARICPECSTSNDDDAAFCKKCATRLEAAAPSTEAHDAVT